jgi:hypothetical protein
MTTQAIPPSRPHNHRPQAAVRTLVLLAPLLIWPLMRPRRSA